jgi:hypothetical protein
MSRRTYLPLTCVALLVGWATGQAAAQQPYTPGVPQFGPGYRTQLNPSLNLLRGGNPAVNYFLGTLPEIDRRSNARMFSSAIYDLEQRTPAGASSSLDADLLTPPPSTGHMTAFGNTAGFFPQTRFGGPSTGAPVAAMPPKRGK